MASSVAIRVRLATARITQLLPTIGPCLPWRELEVGLVFAGGEHEVGAEVGAAFGDEALNQAGFAQLDETLDFLGGQLLLAERALHFEDDARGAIGLRFANDEGFLGLVEVAVVQLAVPELGGFGEIDGRFGFARAFALAGAFLGLPRRKFPGDLGALAQEKRVERAALFRDEALDELGLALGHELLRLLAGDGFLAHQAADFEQLFPAFAVAFAQDVAGGRFAELGLGLRVGPERCELGDIDFVSEIELGLFLAGIFLVVDELEFRRVAVAGARGDESIERADFAGGDELANLGLVHFPAADDLVDGEGAIAGFVGAQRLDHRLAIGGRDDVGDAGVALVFLKTAHAVHEALGLLDDLVHEGVARVLAVLHLAELELPLAGHRRAGELLDFDGADELEELLGLGRGHELALGALHVLLIDEAVDRIGAGGGGAEASFLHGVGELLVFDEFAGAFHGGEQRGFRVARRWFGGLGVELGVERAGAGGFAVGGIEGGQPFRILRLAGVGGVVVDDGFAVNGEPAGRGEDFALCLKGVRGHDAEARGDVELRRRVKRGDEAARDHVEYLGLQIVEVLGLGGGGDDRKVIGDLGVVEDALVGAQPAGIEELFRVAGEVAQIGRAHV